jgi:hypothetical protein
MVIEATDGLATVWGWAEEVTEQATSPGELAEIVGRLVERAARETEARARRVPDRRQVVVGLQTSQTHGSAWSVEQHRSRPDEPVAEQELSGLLARGLRLAASRLPATAQTSDEGWLLADAAIVELTVDEQGVTDPVGFAGQKLGATLYVAVARHATVDLWEKVATELEFGTLTLVVRPLALAAIMTDRDGVLLSVGATETTIIHHRAGRPRAVACVPLGGLAVLQAMQREWDLSFSEAEALAAAHAEGRVRDEDRHLVPLVINPPLLRWVDESAQALAQIAGGDPLPAQFTALGGVTALPEMEAAVQSLSVSEGVSFRRYPQFRCLHPGQVPRVVNRAKGGRSAGDVSALTLASWVALQSGEQEYPVRVLGDLLDRLG